nr:MFS transporter [Methanobrevibacter arboriphilus]
MYYRIHDIGLFIRKIWQKKTLILTSVLFTISSIGSALSTSPPLSLIFYRFIGGIAVGTISFLGPLYISEISPLQKLEENSFL